MEKVLLLTSNDGVQSGPTGYDRLAGFIPSAEVVSCPRIIPTSLVSRLLRKMRSKGAVSKWVMPSSFRLERLARSRIDKGGVGLVHMLWGDRDWARIDLFCKKRNLPLVVTVHPCPGDLPTIFMNTNRLQNVAAFILMSSHQKPFFLERGIPESRLHVIRHGVDHHFFTPRKTTEDRRDGFVFLSVGHTRRNLPLMKALIKRFASDPSCCFEVLTRESFRAEFEGLGNVVFRSNVSNEELRDAYRAADALLLTAEDTTANNALVEAMACGLPILAERVGGIPEYTSAECTLFAPANDLDAMVLQMQQFMSDELLRSAMRKAARKCAEELCWETAAEQTMRLYAQVQASR